MSPTCGFAVYCGRHATSVPGGSFVIYESGPETRIRLRKGDLEELGIVQRVDRSEMKRLRTRLIGDKRR